MDLFNHTLDGNVKVVEGYDSLVWTERFQNTGDFIITSSQIDKYMVELPYNSVVYLNDSTTPMLVEKKVIKRPKKQKPTIEVTGRSLEAILARRAFLNPWGSDKPFQPPFALRPSDAACLCMKWVVEAGIFSDDDIIPPSQLRLIEPPDYYLNPGGELEYTYKYSAKAGNLLDTIRDLLKQRSNEWAVRDIRAIRPTTFGDEFGGYAIEFYEPVDRSEDVAFWAFYGAFDDGTYSFDYNKMVNAVVYPALGQIGIPEPTTFDDKVFGLTEIGTKKSGWERNVHIYYDTQIERPDTMKLRAEPGVADLLENAVLFDGSVNNMANKLVYGVDYDLGDIVGLQADYGIARKVRVTEYIRVNDRQGVRSYPTLSNVDTEPNM